MRWGSRLLRVVCGSSAADRPAIVKNHTDSAVPDFRFVGIIEWVRANRATDVVFSHILGNTLVLSRLFPQRSVNFS